MKMEKKEGTSMKMFDVLDQLPQPQAGNNWDISSRKLTRMLQLQSIFTIHGFTMLSMQSRFYAVKHGLIINKRHHGRSHGLCIKKKKSQTKSQDKTENLITRKLNDSLLMAGISYHLLDRKSVV